MHVHDVGGGVADEVVELGDGDVRGDVVHVDEGRG